MRINRGWRSARYDYGTWCNLVLLILRAAGTMAAGGTLFHTPEYMIDAWRVEEGLPQISVTSIVQTPDGYLWLGTFNGLARFDGVRFTIYDDGNTPALGSSRITRLALDPSEGLWIMTESGGLARMAQGHFTGYGAGDGWPACGAAAFVRDAQNCLFLLDRQGGLSRILGGRVLPFDAGGQGGRQEQRLLVDPAGLCWIQQEGKAVRSTEVTMLLPGFESAPGPAQGFVQMAVPSRAGGVWLATLTQVFHWQGGRITRQTAPFPKSVGAILAIAEDAQGNLWAGIAGQGLLLWDGSGQWQRIGAEAGLTDYDNVTAIVSDREANLWVGTGSGGLHRLKPRTFRLYDTHDGLTGDTVMSLAQDRQGRMWFGINGGGLNCLRDGRVSAVTDPVRLTRHPLVYSVLPDREGGLWIGLYYRGALRLDAAGLAAYTFEEGFPRATPLVLFEDRAGAIWLGGEKGLQRYQAGRFTRYTRAQGLSHDEVRAMAEDRGGTLYIGTSGGGLNCFRNGRFTCLTEGTGLSDNHIMALLVDHDDTLWIGTANGGLSRLKHGRFATFTVKEGLPSNTIGALIEDGRGNLWMGSNRGVIRASLLELNEFADGQRRALTCSVFNRSDGLSSIECSGGVQPACWKAHDGRLWFATVKGAVVVDPARMPFNRLPPPAVIEEVALDDQVHNFQNLRPNSPLAGRPPAELTVHPGTHRIEVRFTALSFVAPEKIRFRYRLDPLDQGWIEAGARRIAYYTGLPAGHYHFQVTACNNDGVWNETGAALSLVVLPPWWMTWWFRALAVIATAGFVLGLVELRLRRLRHERSLQTAFAQRLLGSQEEERKRIAAELHDSIGQNLLVIKNRALLGLRAAGQRSSTEQLHDISEMATQSLEEVREISRNLRPYQLDRLGLTKAIEVMVASLSQSSGLPCDTDLECVDGLLVKSSEIHLYRIVQELLNNVVKHSDAAEARVSLKQQANRLTLIVEDDGRGFDYGAIVGRPAHEHGLGLTDIAERVRILNGKLRCDARPGKGTSWQIEIPVNPVQ